MSKDPPTKTRVIGGRTVTIRGQNVSINLFPADDELLNWIAAQAGCSRSEAVRRALAVYGSHLAYIQGSRLPS